MEIHPYLSFTGNCKEALELYQRALGGKVEDSHLYSENQEMCKNISNEWHDKIMHASFRAGNVFFMASDVPPGGGAGEIIPEASNISLSLNFTDEKEQEMVFNKLAEGANVIMPLQVTFWGAKFGMLRDRFGICWMFNCELKK